MDWQKLEARVRKIAQYKWSKNCDPMEMCGVRYDGVIKLRQDYYIIIEISKQNSLAKLREDIAKFNSCRLHLIADGIYPECYFICDLKPHPSLKSTGENNNINVLDLDGMDKLFFDYEQYVYNRKSKKFGSAITLDGCDDTKAYIPIIFYSNKGEEYTLEEIANRLTLNNKIILLGDYGTGKSRCVKELFSLMASSPTTDEKYSLSIDLRDNWGVKRAQEIIRRHFDDLGISTLADNVLRILDKYCLCILLDGFDEVGAQTLSINAEDLKEMKMHSLEGVRDLLTKLSGGILITGRQHYFSNDVEMFDCLGLDKNTTLVLNTPKEFTAEQISLYLSDPVLSTNFPKWLPRKPLICQLIQDIGHDDVATLLETSLEEKFWTNFFEVICKREATIHPSLDKNTIKNVLIYLARLLRKKNDTLSSLTPLEISEAFKQTANRSAANESLIMLQRSFVLARVSSETADRRFIDEYIVDGLFAEDITNIVLNQDRKTYDTEWTIPIGIRAINIISQRISDENEKLFIAAMRESGKRSNTILGADIALSLIEKNTKFDFKNFTIDSSEINELDISQKLIKNLTIENSIIHKLDISNSNTENFLISKCSIGLLLGVTDEAAKPNWLDECEVKEYQKIETKSDLRQLKLNLGQLAFLSVIQKIYFQTGSGRKYSALIDFEDEFGRAQKKLIDKILNILKHEDAVKIHEGDSEQIYSPNRKFTKRFQEIKDKLTYSTDPIWLKISKITK